MNLRFSIRSAATSIAICGVAMAFSAILSPAQADEWDKRTVLTVNQPIQVEDTYLQPGTYVFKLATLSAERHIVQIFNADESHIINTLIAIPNYRLEPTGKSRFLFWETPPGTARALRAWFYPGDNFGQEFVYPKHLRQIAAVAQAAPPAAPEVAEAPAPLAAAPVETPASVEEPAPAPQAAPTPTPAPAPEATPSPAPPSEPQQLPKTASFYPTIGLAGLFSLMLYGLLRRKAQV